VEQLRVADIAATMGTSESAAKSRLRRAIERLNQALSGSLDKEDLR
jgi:DNA-directed RNA polymerase specialized sigma24 family protein